VIVADVVHATVAVAVFVVVEEAFHIIIFDQIRNYAQKTQLCVSQKGFKKVVGRKYVFFCYARCRCRLLHART